MADDADDSIIDSWEDADAEVRGRDYVSVVFNLVVSIYQKCIAILGIGASHGRKKGGVDTQVSYLHYNVILNHGS